MLFGSGSTFGDFQDSIDDNILLHDQKYFSPLRDRLSRLENKYEQTQFTVSELGQTSSNYLTTQSTNTIQSLSSLKDDSKNINVLVKYWYIVVGVVGLIGYLIYKKL